MKKETFLARAKRITVGIVEWSWSACPEAEDKRQRTVGWFLGRFKSQRASSISWAIRTVTGEGKGLVVYKSLRCRGIVAQECQICKDPHTKVKSDVKTPSLTKSSRVVIDITTCLHFIKC